MKKFIFIILALIVVLTLFGCQNSTPEIPTDTDITDTGADKNESAENVENVPENADTDKKAFVFPAGTVLCGVDVGGMNNSAAYDTIKAKVNAYVLELEVNGKKISITASDMNLLCSRKAITDYYAALSKGKNPTVPEILSYNADYIENAVVSWFSSSARDAQIKYNSSKDIFELTKEAYGASVDAKPAVAAAKEAIAVLDKQASANVKVSEITPDITADSSLATKALEEANKYLTISLKYTYTPDNGKTSEEVLSKDTIASFLEFDGNLNTVISSRAINNYVSKMSDKYSDPGQPGKFKTTGGCVIDVKVTYAGQPVDTDALYNDIYNCISNKVSGTRKAPYVPKTEIGDMSFGGSYIEVDLSSQYLWVYKNGSCVVSTPIVSGCAFYGWTTPTGVYSVNDKTPGCYLYGEGYQTWVDYWIGFIGNSYGVHDASWRDEFGSDIYLYDGSHGCVNVPVGAAASIYNNVSVGTKVVLYGGATSAEPVQQKISGTAEYNVATDTKPFNLDAAAEYAEPKLTYISDNTAVAKVSDDGTVTVTGVGTANITVSAEKAEFYTAASFDVKVVVTNACDAGRHTYGEWTQTKAPTCVEGEEMHKCTLCGYSETRVVTPVNEHIEGEEYIKFEPTCTEDGESAVNCTVCGIEIRTTAIPATGHSFTEDSMVCQNGCATLNPDYPHPDPEPDPEPDDGGEGNGNGNEAEGNESEEGGGEPETPNETI